MYFNIYRELLQEGLDLKKKNSPGSPTPYSDTITYYNDRLFGTAEASSSSPGEDIDSVALEEESDEEVF